MWKSACSPPCRNARLWPWTSQELISKVPRQGKPARAASVEAMLVKRVVLVAATAAIILGSTAVVLDNLAGEQSVPSSTGAGNASSSGRGTAADGVPLLPPGQTNSSLPGGQSTGETGADHAGVPATSGIGDQRKLEVLPPATSSPTGLPMPSPPAAVVNAPLPGAASAKGKVVEGFPSQVLPFPDRTVIVFTGVSPSGNILQATAEGIVELAVEKVTGHFQQVLQGAGFRSEEAAAEAGEQALRFTRGNDSVSVTLSMTGTGSTRFSLLGNFHTEPGP
jgi:hypothetical protein